MKTLPAALCGYGLDCLLGDPASLTPMHPVVWMGKGIRALEPALRERFPRTEKGELAAGTILAALLPVGTVLSSAAILRLCGPVSYFGVRHEKPYIGDDERPITPGDIDRVCRMESAGTLLALALFGGAKLLIGD